MKEKNIQQKGFSNATSKILVATLLIYSFTGIYHYAVGWVISNDGVKYIEIGRLILNSSYERLREIGFYNLYSSTVALAFLFTGDWELSGKLVSFLFGFLSTVSLFLFFRSLLGRKGAEVITFLFGTSPILIRLSNDVLRETLFLFLFFSSLLCALESLRQNKVHLLLFSSLFTLFSLLTRLEGLILLFLLPVLFYSLRPEGKDLLRILCLYYLFIFLFSLPIFLQNGIKDWVRKNPIEAKIDEMANFEKGISLKEKELIDSETGRSGKILRIGKAFLDVIFKTLKALGPVYTLLVVLGFFEKNFKFRRFFLLWLLILFFISGAFAYYFGYFSQRHGFFLSIPLLFWASLGVLKIEKRIKMEYLLVILLVLSLPQNLKPIRIEKLELKVAGLELKSSGIKDEWIVTTPSLGRVVFYSGNFSFPLKASETLEGLREYMNRKGIRYLLLEMGDLQRLGDEKLIERAGFEKVEVQGFERLKEYKLILYKIRDL